MSYNRYHKKKLHPLTHKTHAVTVDMIKDTEAYKQLSTMQQRFVTNHVNVKHIDNGYQIAEKQGYEYFEQNTNHNAQNRAIIKELIIKQ